MRVTRAEARAYCCEAGWTRVDARPQQSDSFPLDQPTFWIDSARGARPRIPQKSRDGRPRAGAEAVSWWRDDQSLCCGRATLSESGEGAPWSTEWCRYLLQSGKIVRPRKHEYRRTHAPSASRKSTDLFIDPALLIGIKHKGGLLAEISLDRSRASLGSSRLALEPAPEPGAR